MHRLLITNPKFSFMKTKSFETGLSNHHHTIYTFLKTKLEKFEPKKLIYRNLKQIDNDLFKMDTCNSMYVNFHLTFRINYRPVKSL